MFFLCYDLKSLDLSGFDTSKVTNMSSMFSMEYSFGSLTSLDLSSFDTSKVTTMNWIFNKCSKLTKIMVSNKWVINSGASTDRMFDNCGTDHVTVV